MNKNKPLINHYFLHRFLLLSGLLLGVCACQPVNRETKSENPPKVITGRSDTQLVLDNAILEQSNSEGNLQWKIKSELTVYSDDRKNADLEVVTANLLQDGKIILKVKGDRAEVKDNGNLIFLKGNVVATDTRNQTIIEGDLAEWRPLENILVLTENLTGSHKNLNLRGKTATYFTDTENLELLGEVVADTINPFLRLETDRLVWYIPQEKIIGKKPWRVVRYQGTIVTERLVSDGGEWNLSTKTLTLSKNIELISLAPPLQIATDSAKWNYEKRTIISDRPIQILDRQRQITITGNQGDMDLTKNIAHLTQGVKGNKKINPAKFYADDLTWNISTQIIEAIGNVFYEQSSPSLELTGDRAVIKLEENNAVVSTDQNNKRRVISVLSDR
ncbi:MAG: LPS export ABC transporter periplasmic protein LptC [Xenococcaceae cyanobacterium MO_188.B19]|nr:LPS export ABC transporter periplasmic protein LptC [Xenococcaceae cyanobacterium MO_188.B19]